jgi:RimJ/RimL family protein N-acetyltransferase
MLTKHRSKPAQKTIQESKDWMVNYILPTEGNWEVDKFALLLKPCNSSERREEEREMEGEEKRLKMIGFVGTNRWSEEGLEVGYCLNIAYWNQGYATEGMRAFLSLFWGLPGEIFCFCFFGRAEERLMGVG